MKTFLCILIFFVASSAGAQTGDPASDLLEEGIEQIAGKEDAVPENDGAWQDLEEWKRHRINLNRADEEDLESLLFLNALQVRNFFAYRTLLGSLLNIYELQAIPAWDLATIYKILPFVEVENKPDGPGPVDRVWKGGRRSLLLRMSEVPERSRGFLQTADSSSSHYLGSPQHIFFRYGFRQGSWLQYGILGDKDPGEQFFRGAQKGGFDFYSFHFFMRGQGLIRSFALGDFTVNMGQGLIHWQGLAFTKTADALAVKRQAALLRPYNSAGEFNFHRGAAVLMGRGNWQCMTFSSYRRVSANLDPDTVSRADIVSSMESSGYHRTTSEIADRNNIKEFVAGGNLGFSSQNFHLGVNAVHYSYSKALQKQDLLYNLYAIRGKNWSNYSIDVSYTHRNLHVFGEAAIDRNSNKAFIEGAIISLGRWMDLSLLGRQIEQAYQALYANAFTENSNPTNEYGLYTGMSLHLSPAWQIDLFSDFYKFPWLRYRADAPGWGRDFFLQILYKPSKNWQLSSRYKNEAKTINAPVLSAAVYAQTLPPRQDWRTEFSTRLSPEWKMRNRVELVWYDQHGRAAGQGYLGLMDFFFKPARSAFDANLRVQYFETSDYASRLYAFEEDMLFNYSVPAFFNIGLSYYINCHMKLNRLIPRTKISKTSLDCWVKWGRTSYHDAAAIGSGLDEIKGDKKSEIKIQIVASL